MKAIKANLDYFLFALIVAGFVYTAAERLNAVPVPDTDESMTLQVPYEMLNHGKLAFPMYSFLGGNIENSWHSFTPVFFVSLTGFMKVFGWGLVQGRAFNLLTTVLLLFVVYRTARKLFRWPVGLMAVAWLVADPVFLTRSRLARNDMLAAAFGWLAFYLVERAAERRGKWPYFAAGLAAGAGVMCHTNLLYMLGVIGALMLLKDGWRLLQTHKPYLFAAGAFVVMAYEIIYDLIDYQNFILQNRKDDIHFRVFELWGWWHNLQAEPARYVAWYNGRVEKLSVETALLRLLLLLAAAAIVYLIGRCAMQIKRGGAMNEPRTRVLIATIIVAFFLALITQRKVIQYVVHLAPWFAVCVGIMLGDALALIRKLRERPWRYAKPAYVAAMVIVALLAAGFGYQWLKQNRRFLAQVRNPELATFDDLKDALRRVVPEGLCPVSIGSGFLWLAFPEHDRCYFAFMEARLDEALDLNKDYALIIAPKFNNRLQKLTGGTENYHLIGELRKTVYGKFYIYYTGKDPRYLALTPRRFYFFGRQRGYVSDDQIAQAREVWSADREQLQHYQAAAHSIIESAPTDDPQTDNPTPRRRLIELCAIELAPGTIYQVSVEADAKEDWELSIIDDGTGAELQRLERSEQDGQSSLEGLFKTSSGKRVRLALRRAEKTSAALSLARLSIRELAPVAGQ